MAVCVVSDEDDSVLRFWALGVVFPFLLCLCDELGSFQGFNHSLVSLTIVPVPNFTILFGLTSDAIVNFVGIPFRCRGMWPFLLFRS